MGTGLNWRRGLRFSSCGWQPFQGPGPFRLSRLSSGRLQSIVITLLERQRGRECMEEPTGILASICSCYAAGTR